MDAKKAEQNERDAEAKELLSTLNKSMTQRCAAVSAQLKEAAVSDRTLPIVAVIDKTEKYKLDVSEAGNEEVMKGIKDLLTGKYLKGLCNIVGTAITVFLGSESEGESQETGFHVVYANNGLLRVDYMIYKYHFTSEAILKKHENAFCYIMQIGVLDLEKVNSQILLYEMTKTIGETDLRNAANELRELAAFAKELYSTIHDLNRAAKPDEEEDPTEKDQVGHKKLLELVHPQEDD